MLKNAISWYVGALLWLYGAVLVAEPVDFPEAPELNSAVEFWKRVYVEESSDGGLLHDSVDLGVVYERFDFDDGKSLASRKKQINRARTKWEQGAETFRRRRRTLWYGGKAGCRAISNRIGGENPRVATI